jgi:hypothetical protein
MSVHFAQTTAQRPSGPAQLYHDYNEIRVNTLVVGIKSNQFMYSLLQTPDFRLCGNTGVYIISCIEGRQVKWNGFVFLFLFFCLWAGYFPSMPQILSF